MSFENKKVRRAIDLFSGCGGLTLGLRQAGFRVVAAVENEELAASTFRMNNRQTLVLEEDIRSINPDELRTKLKLEVGELDLLAGCPPCQGFSRIRTLNGTRSNGQEQNELVYSVFPIVEAFLPKTIMLENVPGLMKDHRLQAFEEFLARFGYTFEKRVLDASDFGVPQRRRRMIFVASRFGEIQFPSPSKRKKSVRAAIGSIAPPGQSGDALHDYSQNHSRRTMQIISSVPQDGGSRSDLDDSLKLECHRKSDGFSDVYGRMRWADASPTITGGCINPSKGRFIHPEQNRAITVREASLLQGFPKSYKFDQRKGRYSMAQMIGNAFPPRFARVHAEKVFEHLQSLEA